MTDGGSRHLHVGGALLTALVVMVWAAALLWSVLRAPSSTIPMDVGDPILNASILHWSATRTPFTTEWWNFPSYVPARGVTTFTEHLLGLWPLAAPTIWMTGDPVLAYNLTFYLSFVLNALAMYALVRTLTGSTAGAIVAALAFTCNPYRGGQFSHIQMIMTWGMPLALLGLHRYLAGGRATALVLFGAGWLGMTLSNAYFIVFFGVFVGCWVLWFCTARDAWRRLPGILAAAAIASLPLVPIVLKYIEVHRQYGFARSPGEIIGYSADIAGLFFAHPAASVATRFVPPLAEEGALFPGFAVLALGAAGMMRGIARRPVPPARRALVRVAQVGAVVFLAATVTAALTDVRLEGPIRFSISQPHKPMTGLLICLTAVAALSPRFRAAAAARDAALFYALMAVLMWLLSLGPEARLWGERVLYQPPYAWLLKVPGTTGLRVPARFWMLAVMALCVLAGYAVAALRRRRTAVAVAISVVVLIEGWMDVAAAAIPEKNAPRPAAVDAAVLELPMGNIGDEIAAQFRAVLGGYRTLNGYSGFDPPHVHPLRVGVRLREGGVLTELRRRMPLHVSVIANDEDGFRSWIRDTQQDATVVSAAVGRVLYLLPQLPPVPADEGSERRFVISGVSCSAEKAPLVVDGSLQTRWDCGPAWPGQQITVELLAPARVCAVSLALGPYTTDAPRNLLVEASDDGITWRTVWSGLGAPHALAAAIEDPKRIDLRFRFTPARARRVRLTQTGDTMEWYWSVAELRVLGIDDTGLAEPH